LNSPHFGTQKSHFSIHQICFGFELLSIWD
jgi:hypothetical protein